MAVVWTHHFAGRYEEAIREAKRTREIVPTLEEAGNVMIASYEAMGRLEEAAALMSTQRFWNVTFDGARLLDALTRGGPRAYWEERLAQLDGAVPPPPGLHFGRAIVFHYLGDIERQLEATERMVDEHVSGSVFIGVDRTLAAMQGHPRYEALLKRVGVALKRTASGPHTVST